MSAFVSFGEALRRRRRALDLTQQQLAERVGCATTTIVKFENETRRPSHEMASRLAEILQVPAGERAEFLQMARRRARAISQDSDTPTAVRRARPSTFPLPAAPLPLLGRDGEIAVLKDLFARADCQLVTLVGPGGIGKTRLAVQVATELAPRFADGVAFVALTSLASAQTLPVALADAVGCPYQDVGDLRAQLIDYLRPLEMLLVLDSIEHLLDEEATTELATTLLDSAPGLALLITSRERLNLQREWVFELQGLSIPPPPQSSSDSTAVAAVELFPAAALFLQHARRLRPSFAPTQQEVIAISQICRSVEGLPLAIELSAAWTPTLSCTEIADEIERSIDFLAAAVRDLPPRHRSVRAVFDHSWQRLSVAEQRVMRRLAVFRGGFTRRAAEQVAGASLRQLSALVAKSLVRHGDGGRYDLHELIGQYSAAQLQAAGEETATREAHAVYYLTMATDYLDRLRSADQKQALAELSRDIDNLRSAWHWAVEHGQVKLLQQAAWAYWYFLDMRNLYREEEAAFARAEAALHLLANDGSDPQLEVALAEMRTWRAFACFRLGRVGEGLQLLAVSQPVLRRHNAPAELTDSLWVYGLLGWLSGQFEEAARALDESLALSAALASRWRLAFVPLVLGAVRHEQGRYDEAYAVLRQGLDRCLELGVARNTAFALGLLARTVSVLGCGDDLHMLMQEHLHLATEMEDRSAMAFVMENLALAVQSGGDPASVRQYFGDAIDHYADLGDLWSASRTLCYAGQFELAQGEVDAAHQLFRRALQTALAGQSNANALDALAGLAGTYRKQGAAEMALRLALTVDQHPASSQAARDRAGQVIVQLSGGPEETTRMQALALEEAAAMALRT